MRIRVKESGIVIVKDPPWHNSTMSFLRRVKGTNNVYWSSWRWLTRIEECFGPTNGIEGAEHLEALKKRDRLVRQTMELQREIERPEFFRFPLWACQRQGAAAMCAAKKFLLAYDVGLGKTLTAFLALLYLKLKKEIRFAAIVCPASVIYQWQAEIKNALKPEFRPYLNSVVVHGTPADRTNAYGSNAFIYLVTYESLYRDIKEHKESPFTIRIDAIVLDEAQKIKNPKIPTSRAIQWLCQRIPYRFALTATPVANRYIDLLGIYSVIDPLTFLSYTNFHKRYLRYKLVKTKKGRRFPLFLGYDNVHEIKELTRHSLLLKEVNDVTTDKPAVLVSSRWVELDPLQKQVYQAIKGRRSYNDLTRVVKARIACLLSKPFEKAPKVVELKGVLADVLKPTEKALIFSESKVFLKLLYGYLRKLKYNCSIITGADKVEDRAVKCRAFSKGKIRLLLLTSAGQAGLNLQAADTVVNMDLPWSPASLRQRVGRVRPHLGGASRVVKVINILSRNTIEDRVVDTLKAKLGHIADLFQRPVDDLTGVFDHKALVEKL